jgi:hypothetical protein
MTDREKQFIAYVNWQSERQNEDVDIETHIRYFKEVSLVNGFAYRVLINPEEALKEYERDFGVKISRRHIRKLRNIINSRDWNFPVEYSINLENLGWTV